MKRIRFEITSRCSFGCRHCYITPETWKLNDLPLEAVKKILDKLTSQLPMKILFLGGEPFERADLLQVLAYAKRKGFVVDVDTNGWNMDVNTVSELKRIGVDTVIFTVYGTQPHTNDVFTKPGHFKKLTNAITACRAAGINTDAAILITRKNFRYLFQSIKFQKKYGIRNIYVDVFMTTDDNELSEKYRLSFFQFYLFWGILRWFLIKKRTRKNKIGVSFCDSITFPLIKSNGDIWPCLFYGKPIANIHSDGMETISRILDTYNLERDICSACVARKLDKIGQRLVASSAVYRGLYMTAHRAYNRFVGLLYR